MKEYLTGEDFKVGAGDQTFKVLMTSGSVSMQFQAGSEGYNEITGGSYTTSADGVVTLGTGDFKVVLTGDAQFFMG